MHSFISGETRIAHVISSAIRRRLSAPTFNATCTTLLLIVTATTGSLASTAPAILGLLLSLAGILIISTQIRPNSADLSPEFAAGQLLLSLLVCGRDLGQRDGLAGAAAALCVVGPSLAATAHGRNLLLVCVCLAAICDGITSAFVATSAALLPTISVVALVPIVYVAGFGYTRYVFAMTGCCVKRSAELYSTDTLCRSVLPGRVLGASVLDKVDTFANTAVLFLRLGIESVEVADANRVVVLDRLCSAFDQVVMDAGLFKMDASEAHYIVAAGGPAAIELNGRSDLVVDEDDELVSSDTSGSASSSSTEASMLALVRLLFDLMAIADSITFAGQRVHVSGGIAVGPTAGGILGSQRIKYTLIGPPVNLASRICDISETGSIVIPLAYLGSDWRDALPDLQASDPFVATLKGLHEPLELVILSQNPDYKRRAVLALTSLTQQRPLQRLLDNTVLARSLRKELTSGVWDSSTSVSLGDLVRDVSLFDRLRCVLPSDRLAGDLVMPPSAHMALVNLSTAVGGVDAFLLQVETLLLILSAVPAAMAALELLSLRLADEEISIELATIIIVQTALRSVAWVVLGLALLVAGYCSSSLVLAQRAASVLAALIWLLLEVSFAILLVRISQRQSLPNADSSFLAIVEFGLTLSAEQLFPLPWLAGVSFALSIGAGLVAIVLGQGRYHLAVAAAVITLAAVARMTDKARTHLCFAARSQALTDALAAKQPLLQRLLPQNAQRFLLSAAPPVPTTHRQVVLVRMDVQGFTAACTRVTPAAMMTWLNAVYSRADELLVIAGGYKIDVLGDAYVAAFGTLCDSEPGEKPVAEKPLSRRVCAARSFAEGLHAIMDEVPGVTTSAGHQLTLVGRVGLHVGDAVACVTGSIRVRQQLYGDCMRVLEATERAAPCGGTAYSAAVQAVLDKLDRAGSGGSGGRMGRLRRRRVTKKAKKT